MLSRLACFVLLLGPGLLLTPCAAQLSPSAWKEDLEFLSRELPARHKNLFHRLPQEEFEREVKSLGDAIPGMPESEVRTALVRLVSLARNAHTRINALNGSPVYPIQFRRFGRDYYVVRAREEDAGAVGARLTAIGGLAMAEVRKRLLPLVPLETELMEATQLPGLMRNRLALQGTRIVPGDESVGFSLEQNGRTWTIALPAGPREPQIRMTDKAAGARFETPLYLTDPRTPYWFRYLEDQRALYIQYNSRENMPSLPFAGFTRKVMEVADAKPVTRVILDMRHNGGGDSELMNPLVDALKKRPALRKKGRLFVLTSPNTFSSGLLNTWRLQKAFKATVAGEPSAQRPNTYGDVRNFLLPNSKLRVEYCTKYFHIVPGDPESLAVDMPVELAARDYFAGRDAVLERVLAGGRPQRPR